jgi:hypothetical protein
VRFVLGAVSIFTAGLAAVACVSPALLAASPAGSLGRLSYAVEWRLIHAGDVVIESKDSGATARIESAGLVSTLFKIDNTYTAHFGPAYCATDSLLDSKEGKRHHQTSVTYEHNPNRAVLLERDLIKNEIMKSATIETPPCVHDVLGGMLALRGLTLEPGQSMLSPVSDGRRAAQVKVEAEEREEITTPAGKFKTTRYEINIMNGVVYMRKGRVFVWLTDDSDRLPVQILLRLAFPIGSVTLQLEKPAPSKEDSK